MTPLHSTVGVRPCQRGERKPTGEKIGTRYKIPHVSVQCKLGKHSRCYSSYCTCECHLAL